MPATADTHRLGLRFPTSDAPLLRDIAARLKEDRRPHEDISLFDKAADSAERAEPLIIVCNQPQDAVRIAHGFTRWGIQRPAIDELNGKGET